jgi:hypothetical protein
MDEKRLTAVWRATVALPLEGHEVGQVVVEAHARAGGVAPIVHLAAPEKGKLLQHLGSC